MLMGCQQSIKVSPVTLPANLKQPCPDLQTLDSGTGEAILKWGVDTVAKYNDCKARHIATVNVIEKPSK